MDQPALRRVKLIRVAVIGAGMAGSAAAQFLNKAGMQVKVFDKSRGAGGRASTRKVGDVFFDHGAQYFTARSVQFRACVTQWLSDGVAAPWRARFASMNADGLLCRNEYDSADQNSQRFVGVPGMNAVVRSLHDSLDVQWLSAITGLARVGQEWFLHHADGAPLGGFDAVVVSAPAPQSASFFENVAPELARECRQALLDPCWSYMFEISENGTVIDVGFDALELPHHQAIAWLARDGSKPGRLHANTWVAQASAQWSRDHLQANADEVARALSVHVCELLGLKNIPTNGVAHRWRFAKVSQAIDRPFIFDAAKKLWACGDWCMAARLEAAWLSGISCARALIQDMDQG